MSGTPQAPGSTGPALFSVVAGTLYVSTDGGVTWSSGTDGLPAGTGLVKVTSGTGGLATAYTDYLPGGSWFAKTAAAHAAAVPALTVSVPIQLGINPVVATKNAGITDAAVEGGAAGSTGGAIMVLNPLTVWQNPKTSKFAVSFLCSVPAPTTGKACQFGAMAAGGNSDLIIASDFNKSTSQFVAYGYNGAFTSAVLLGAWDSAVHTWTIASDGTTVTFYKDGVSVGTMLTSTANFPTAASGPAFYSDTAFVPAFYECLYSFVGPAF